MTLYKVAYTDHWNIYPVDSESLKILGSWKLTFDDNVFCPWKKGIGYYGYLCEGHQLYTSEKSALAFIYNKTARSDEETKLIESELRKTAVF